MSLFEIKCPMCKGTLWIDPATLKVVDHKSADHPKASLEQFLQAQKKGVAWDDKFQKAKEEEARRKAEIEMKFKKAKEEDDGSVEPFKSPFDWD
ncbi:MAG: hypothetical protein GX267_17465 [Fibrobacter sp.]|jgi:hypothetical protein|nr:hypothetical protein [Fibrobacter sp.]